MTFPQADIRVLRERLHQRPWAWLLVLLCFPGHVQAQARIDVAESPRDAKWVQAIVDDYRAQLGIPQRVDVEIVSHNALVTSVQPVEGDTSTFALRVEESFLAGLLEDDVRAVVAHELGHVWIFTHHPYLQTEGLANQIARRVVARDHLVDVYEKLWQRQGATGDLARLVGD
jgi:hypothetical protein